MADHQSAQDRLAFLYQGQTFARAADEWTQVLTEHLTRLQNREGDVLNWDEPSTNVQRALDSLGRPKSSPDAVQEWIPAFRDLLRTALEHGQNLHHPRYIGHQVPASIPIAALFDALGAVTNQVMAIYEMGPWATSVERAMIERLGCEIGYPPGEFSGLVTSGGSLANLTSLLTARNVVLGDSWRSGISDARQLAIAVQEDAHYCVLRTAGILGIGSDQIVRIPVDEKRKMRVDVLDETLRSLQHANRKVLAVVAGACATPIGAFDPLDAIADVCERYDVWFHVDAAHGGGALMSDTYRHLCKGLSRADSVVWDAHKMLFMPALCAFAFYKNKRHRFVTFEQDAPYLFDPSSPGMADFDSGIQTIECTKRAATFAIWGMWSLFGRQLFSDLIDVSFASTRSFFELLRESPDFEPLHEPECNIQVFRYLPDYVRDWSEEQVGQFQLDLRRWLITSGHAYIVPIKIHGVGALRATVINPSTREEDFQVLLDHIRQYPRTSG